MGNELIRLEYILARCWGQDWGEERALFWQPETQVLSDLVFSSVKQCNDNPAS